MVITYGLVLSLPLHYEILFSWVGQMPRKGKPRREEDDGVNVLDERSLLREEISNLESQLRKSLFTSIEGHEVFMAKLQSADNVQLLSEVILELEDSLYDRAMKEKMNDSANTAFSRDEWRAFMKDGETISTLSVLLCILEKRIDWEQSAINKVRLAICVGLDRIFYVSIVCVIVNLSLRKVK